MKITDIKTIIFRYKTNISRDWEGHHHPGLLHDEEMALINLVTDEGIEGYCFSSIPGGAAHDNRLKHFPSYLKQLLIGEDPLNRERIQQKMWATHRMRLDETLISIIDMALWDFAGKLTGLPTFLYTSF